MSRQTVTAIAQAVATLDRAAVVAKQQEATARDQARRIRRTIDALREACDELGIHLILDTPNGTDPGEEPQPWPKTSSSSTR